MDRITQSLLTKFSESYELEKLETSEQFEHFCNYSVISKHHKRTFSLYDIHTGNGGDSAIDGCAFIVNGRLITSVDELNDLCESSGVLDCDIIIVQAKTSSNFDNKEVAGFFHGVSDFLSEKSTLEQNDDIKKAKEIWDTIIENSPYMLNRRPNLKVFYVTTGKWVGDKNISSVLNKQYENMQREAIFENISIEMLGANEIQKLYLESKNKLTTQISFHNRVTLPEMEALGVKEAFLGYVPFAEYIKLIQDDNETIHSIFDDNVRDFQGENEVNLRIKETLTEGNYELFCVLNNGVTVVANSITATGSKFTLRDYQVVNGCQTSNVLHQCRHFEGIENLSVPLKLIVTTNDEIKAKITLATNSQTEVKPEQLESLSSFQRRLELFYDSIPEPKLVHYERRAQQYHSDSRIKKTQIITIPVQIKAFASMFLHTPHSVSGYYGTIARNFKEKIFLQDHKLETYYASGLCHYRLDSLYRNGEIDKKYKKIRYQLMLLVRMLVMGEKLDYLNSNRIMRQSEKLINVLSNIESSKNVFKDALLIYKQSPLDKNKDRHKTETETQQLIYTYRSFVKNNKKSY
ncbi:AIPR family protein [Photobacterium leiognathi]|uniref:AIPR family protein n=1 Tax=Photobacterium leiognathi TaxID=553611 RepID=UPI00273A3C8B|nr:AIPR family protein [Photobacterium leiognathi]